MEIETMNLEDLMKELTEQKKPLVKKEITENEYIDSALTQAQNYLNKYNNLCSMMQELYRKISRGDIIKYYKTEDGLHYEIKDKRKAGF